MLLLSVLRFALAKRIQNAWALLLGIVATCCIVWSQALYAKEPVVWAGEAIAYAELPKQGRAVYDQIHRGEPFSHSKDGSIFGNRERLLPLRTRGYYREYTVRTPGVKHRGARRIVCGGLQVSQPDVCYYTADHYASFRKIVP